MTLQQCTRQVDSSAIVVRLFLLMSISAVAQQADKKKLSATVEYHACGYNGHTISVTTLYAFFF